MSTKATESRQFLWQRRRKRLRIFESVFKVMHQQGNLAFGQVIGNQVDDKSERNRDGQEKSGKLIWNLGMYIRRLDPNEIRKKTGLQECDNSRSHIFLARKTS